jgi:hypothetical protein
MTQISVTTIRPAVQAPAVIYIPEIHIPRIGTYFPELSGTATTKATVVADIAKAQHEDVSRVIAIDIAAGTSWDASKEIAGLVLDVVLSEHDGRVPAWCVDFLEEHLGVGYVRQCEQEAA